MLEEIALLIGIYFFENMMDLAFSPCGINKEPIATNLQRIFFERTLRRASDVLMCQPIKKVVYGRSNKLAINRNVLN